MTKSSSSNESGGWAIIDNGETSHVDGKLETVGGTQDSDCCDCGHEIFEDDLIYLGYTATNATSNDCELQIKKLKNKIVTITTEVEVVQKKLQDALDNSTELKTQLVAANADAQKWKTNSDSLDIDLKQSKQINVQLTDTVNEYNTTISNLRTTIDQITSNSNKCGTELDEWKTKWATANDELIKNEKTIKDLQASNGDLNSKIAKLTDDLSSSRNRSQQNDIDISTLKNNVTDLTKQLSNCTVDLGTCNVALKRVTDNFNADELKAHEEEKTRSNLDLQLSACVARTKELETNYDSEKQSVLDCKNETVTLRDECSKQYQKYDNDIAELKSNCTVSVDKCEASLKAEKDNDVNTQNQITQLKNQIVDIEGKLNASIKDSDDWQKKNQYCEDNAVILNQTINTLQTNIADTNNHLSTCVANSNSLQSDLTSCKSNWEACKGDLSDTQTKLAGNETIIVNLNTQIDSLESSKKQCLTELSTLRCDVNQNLDGIKSAEDKAYASLLQVLSILDGNKKLLSTFVGSHNITCGA